eukprot:scaffold1066_cov177-Skeletonema_marinoi.AAC.6
MNSRRDDTAEKSRKNVRSRTTGTVRVISRSITIDIQLCFKGKCRTSFPRIEPIEDRRHYPDTTSTLLSTRRAGGHTDEEMECAGLVCGLMAVLEHLKNTIVSRPRGESAACPCAIDMTLDIEGGSDSIISQIQQQGSSQQGGLYQKCTKLLEDIETTADSLRLTFGGVITSRQHNIVLDRLVNEAMDEQRSGALRRREIKPCRNIS